MSLDIGLTNPADPYDPSAPPPDLLPDLPPDLPPDTTPPDPNAMASDPNAPDPNAPDPNAPDPNAPPLDALPGLGASSGTQSFSVPNDLTGPINDAAAQYGIPYPVVLAAALYELTRFAKTKINSSVITAVAKAIQTAYQSQLGSRDVPAAQTDPGTVRDLWFGAASRVTGVSKSTFDNLTRKAPPTSGNIGFRPAGAISGGGGGGGGTGRAAAAPLAPLIPGLTDEQAAAVQRVADALFLQYTGKFPTTEEYVALSKGGFTAQTLEAHLRGQPDPRYAGQSVGGAFDLTDLANKQAQAILGRDATPGEINWLLTNHIPINVEHLSAFYTQTRDHAVWTVKPGQSPKDWLAMQARVQRVWDQFGLTGTVPWQMVNAAEMGSFTDQQITTRIKALPAPGQPAGITVGEVDRVRQIGQSIKDSLFPGETLTPEEITTIVKMSPEAMTQYFRNQPSRDAPGVTAGAAKDYRTMADKFFTSMGITGELPSPADLLFLSTTKADYSQLGEHFSQALAWKYPGLPFGMSSEDYQSAISGFGDALSGVFGAGSPELAKLQPSGSSKQQRESSVYGAALADKMSPQALAGTVDEFRSARGRAPTGNELRQFRDQPRAKLPQNEAAPSYQQTEGGPASGAKARVRGDPHPAVSA